MKLYKKIQINKKIEKNKCPSTIKIKSNIYFNNKITNDMIDLSNYQIFKSQIDENKSNQIQKYIQPVNF